MQQWHRRSTYALCPSLTQLLGETTQRPVELTGSTIWSHSRLARLSHPAKKWLGRKPRDRRTPPKTPNNSLKDVIKKTTLSQGAWINRQATWIRKTPQCIIVVLMCTVCSTIGPGQTKRVQIDSGRTNGFWAKTSSQEYRQKDVMVVKPVLHYGKKCSWDADQKHGTNRIINYKYKSVDILAVARNVQASKWKSPRNYNTTWTFYGNVSLYLCNPSIYLIKQFWFSRQSCIASFCLIVSA